MAQQQIQNAEPYSSITISIKKADRKSDVEYNIEIIRPDYLMGFIEGKTKQNQDDLSRLVDLAGVLEKELRPKRQYNKSQKEKKENSNQLKLQTDPKDEQNQ